MEEPQKQSFVSTSKEYNPINVEKFSFLLSKLNINNKPLDLLRNNFTCCFVQKEVMVVFMTLNKNFVEKKLSDGEESIIFGDRSSQQNKG